jgi:hypothetical protein
MDCKNDMRRNIIKAAGITCEITEKDIKEQCYHWGKYKPKNRIYPIVVHSDIDNSKWHCRLCQSEFGIEPKSVEDAEKLFNEFLEQIEQTKFYGVKFNNEIGTNKELFVNLKRCLESYHDIMISVHQTLNDKFKSESAILDEINKSQEDETIPEK